MLPYEVNNDNVLLTKVVDETEKIKMIPSTTNQPSESSPSSSSSSTVTNQKHDDNLNNLNHKVIKDDDNNNNKNHLISEENKIVDTEGNDINTITDYKSNLVLRSSMKNFNDYNNNNNNDNNNNKQIKEKEVTFDMNPMIRDISRASDQINYSFNNSENTSLSSLTIDKYSFHLTAEEKQKYLTMVNNNNNNNNNNHDDKVKRKTKNRTNKKTHDCCCCSCTIV